MHSVAPVVRLPVPNYQNKRGETKCVIWEWVVRPLVDSVGSALRGLSLSVT